MLAKHRFHVPSSTPDDLTDLEDLARNLAWAWNADIAAVFDRIHGSSSWRDNNGHPLTVLESTSPARWSEIVNEPEFVGALATARARFKEVRHAPQWFDRRRTAGDSDLGLVAYFSPEFGISEALPQYSGGLGILAGDHLKASADLGVPLVGVGLLYAEGYFHQDLNPDGWQEEHNDRFDPEAVGIQRTDVSVSIDLAGVDVQIAVWRVDVGSVPLYLLDTNVMGNPPEAVAITNRLYGGDEQHRLRQEIVLGIGGVRALRALDLHPQVFHMNEGHAGFLGLERVREFVGRRHDLRRSDRGNQLRRGVHDPHPRPGRHRQVPTRAVRAVLPRLRRRARGDVRGAVRPREPQRRARRQVQHGGDGHAPRRPPQRGGQAPRQRGA